MVDVIFLKKHAPRWLVLLIDFVIAFFSISLAYLLRFNFSLPEDQLNNVYYVIPFVLAVRLISFVISRTYAGIVRYTSTRDAVRIFGVIILGSLLFAILNGVSYAVGKQAIIPLTVVVIDFFTNVFLMTAFRFLVKTVYMEYKHSAKHEKNVLIYGADEYALTAKRTLERESNSIYQVVAFIDDGELSGKKLDGLKIYHLEDLDDVLVRYSVNNLIFAKKIHNPRKRQEIIENCLNYDVKVLSVPNINDWINGELSLKQIREVKIEDLLEREPIKLDEEQIRKEVVNKVVLVTGAAGSIGSEIVRQLARFNPKQIVVFDHAESPLYDLELELREKMNYYNFEIVIGSVTNPVRVNKIFEAFKPSIVYHAAAYKHVPMMENNPSEAVRTNVGGTKIMADMSVKYKVHKFVMISTDKAVNPTNVMGASKRIAEIYTQSLNKVSSTKFITTRFGNVLGSNGSVIPRFKKQIETGGPVTVTHPDVTRYFMTIPEACQLVLEASAFGQGGEIFIFDMGKSVKIVDLAKKMIKLSGFTLGKDIQIHYTGLRPGEKLYEELLNNKENTMPTHHSQIMIGKVQEYEFDNVSKDINLLIKLLERHNNFEIVGYMKRIVPEFKSKNSEYEELDITLENERDKSDVNNVFNTESFSEDISATKNETQEHTSRISLIL